VSLKCKVQSLKPKAQPRASRFTPHVSRLSAPAGDCQLSAIVHQLTSGRGLDAAVIAVPSDAVVREAQALVRGAGQVLLFSHTRRGDQTSVDLATVCVDEKDLIGSYSADFRLQAEVARLVFSRKLDTRRLITHEFPLAETAAAIELASHPTAESLKVVVTQGSAQKSG
jgi:L-iditol 2-dehydrogenase